MQSIWTAQQIQGNRTYQEDFFAVVENAAAFYKGNRYELAEDGLPDYQSLYLLTDGMGGETHGDLAAECVIETFIEAYTDSVTENASVREKLSMALSRANDELAILNSKLCMEQDKDKIIMGCTLLAVLWDSQQQSIQWLSVGDSPLWLYHNKQLRQINERHVYAEEAKKNKQAGIPFDETLYRMHANALSSVVMGGEIQSVDLPESPLPLYPGDLLMLASDGMETLSFADIGQVLSLYDDVSEVDTIEQAFDTLNTIRKHLFSTLDHLSDAQQDNSTLLLGAFL